MTKPVDAKHGGKRPIVVFGEKTKPHVEMANTETDSELPVETTGSSAPVCDTQDKHYHKIRCKICIDSFSLIRELNAHH